MSADLRETCARFCDRWGGADAVLLDYLSDSLAEADVEGLVELIAGFLEPFAALSPAEQEEQAVLLLAQAAALAEEAPAVPLPPPPPANAGGGPHYPAAVAVLVELCPQLSASYAAHALRGRFRGDAAAFAESLLCGGEAELLAAQQAFEEAGSARLETSSTSAASAELDSAEAREVQAALRALIVGRYDLTTTGGGTRPVAWGTGQETAKSKVRFHNGEVATRNGDKYVVEKLTPEWDGGSRGRVETKGKRGPGYV